MRRVVLAVVGLGLAATVLPIAGASANCEITIDGHCYNACSALLAPYGKADQAAGGKLPDVNCPA